jgi:serine/threonine protein kinase
MLTGYHPFHVYGDNEHTYIKRISTGPIREMLDKACKKYEISYLAMSFIKRLLARGISDRYSVNQALAHPWISRNLNEEIPLTQNESNY